MNRRVRRAKTLDRIPAVKGEIRFADRAVLQASPASRFPCLPSGGKRAERLVWGLDSINSHPVGQDRDEAQRR